MEIKIDKLPESIKEIPSEKYNVEMINSIERRYKALRQQSKAPTFRPYLWRYIQNIDD